MTYITFEGTPITNIINEVVIKQQRSFNTSPYVGSTGSSTNFVSELGRVISFKSIIPRYERDDNDKLLLDTYKELADIYKGTTGILTSVSDANLKGNYLITGFELSEDSGNNFTISWEFTEVMPFNSVKKTFRVWGSAAKATSTTKKKTTTTVSKSTANANTKKLLQSCGILSPSNKVRSCVKYLQKFLQALGYYKGYKIDGLYQTYTKQAVKKLQKNKKLPYPTGNWNKSTISYFKKKYKLK